MQAENQVKAEDATPTNEALISGLEALEAGDEGDSDDAQTEDQVEPSESDEAEETAEAEAEETAEAEAEETAEGESDEPEAEAESEEPKAEGPLDPAVEKRLQQLMDVERRGKDAVAKERDELRAERDDWIEKQKEWIPRVQAAEKIEARLKAIEADPMAALAAVERTADEWEQIARDAWDEHLAAKGDASKASKSRARRAQAQTLEKQSALEKELEELRGMVKAQEERAAQAAEQQAMQQMVTDYVKAVEAAVNDDETPLVKMWLANSPERAREQLRIVAGVITEETGEVPDHADVVRELEKIRRVELEEDLGIDWRAALAAQKKQTPAKTGKKQAAKTMSTQSTNKTRPTAQSEKRSLDEQADDVLRALESGVID